MIVEVGFSKPGSVEIISRGQYICILPCNPGDTCRVHDPLAGYRVGMILRILPEPADKDSGIFLENPDRTELQDVFEVIPVRNGIAGNSYSIYPKSEIRKRSSSARAAESEKAKKRDRGHNEIPEDTYTIFEKNQRA